jgi:dipeptidyl-peptidase-4
MVTRASNASNRWWLTRAILPLAIAGAAMVLARPEARALPQEPRRTPTTAPRADDPGQERYDRVASAMQQLVTGGRVSNVRWSDDGASVTFNRGRERFTFDLTTKTMAPADTNGGEGDDGPRAGGRRGGRGGSGGGGGGGAMPARGRQRDREASPDGQWVAVCADWNVVVEPSPERADAGGPDASKPAPIKVTTNGNRKFRYGTASWVYGEELDQRDAMWWSPDSSKLAFYEFDEQKVPDHFITAGLTDLHTKVLTEGYPKPGEPNPIANLCVYDLASETTKRVQAPSDEGEWYTYAVRWSPDGNSLLFNRTNRHQNVLHVMAADPSTGQARVVVTEKQETWQGNRPLMRFLEDGQRFIWETEANGWKNYQLRHLDGRLLATLTDNEYPVLAIEKVDEPAGVVYYTAFSDQTRPLNAHLHSARLDGTGHRQLTSEPLNHTTVDVSPDGKWFIATAEASDTPPTSAIYSIDGTRIATLAESDRTRFDEMQMQMPELFTFKADDGTTDLYGVLFKPSDFDEQKKYPLLIDVYGGPESQAVRNRFVAANPACEYGFIIAKIDNRGTVNRGKAFESTTYLQLGEKDMKDQADAVRFLAKRPYIDASRVGIYGHSYGGYMAALGILKHPDVFHVAVAGAPVTDWKNYDTIYTERYMRTPQENAEGYAIGSCLTYAKNLKGNLLLVQGMVDDNVHPNNTFQLVEALQEADIPFDLMLYPNFDHGIGGNYSALRWRYLRKHLIDG